MRVFITGLSGTLGTAVAALHHARGDQVWGCSRSESRAVEWLERNARVGTLYVCDAGALADGRTDAGRLLHSMDRVYHCAALKHVNICEEQPEEAFRQNVGVTAAVAVACKEAGVPLVFVSSDKACLPTGVYGLTKLAGEKIALRHGAAVVRLGNLIGSSGSVFQAWREAREKGGRVRLTDPEMTRYFLSVPLAAEFLAGYAVPGRVSVPSWLRAACMGEVARAVAGSAREVETVGPRPGETRHQWLVAPGERLSGDNGRLVLGEGPAHGPGLSSERAERWDVKELLAAAGVRA